MCFSQPASLFFAFTAFGTAAILRARGHPFRRWQMFAYFGIMEVIQFLAYFVVDQCDNPVNKILTMAAYLHVLFQNISVNTFFLSKEHGVHPDVLKLITGMALIGGTSGLLFKLPWPVWLGASPYLLDPLAKALPEFYSLTTAGTPNTCQYEAMCGPQVCTVSTPNHIAWSLPIMPPSYYLPAGSLHFYFFFFPTMIMADWTAKLTMVGAFFMGPVFTQLLAARHMGTYSWEWPATWCYLSVGQCAIALAIEFGVAMWEAKSDKPNGIKQRLVHDDATGSAADGITSDAKATIEKRIRVKCN